MRLWMSADDKVTSEARRGTLGAAAGVLEPASGVGALRAGELAVGVHAESPCEEHDRADAEDEVRDERCCADVVLRDALTEEEHDDVQGGELGAV